jgi:hypothetical protein
MTSNKEKRTQWWNEVKGKVKIKKEPYKKLYAPIVRKIDNGIF